MTKQAQQKPKYSLLYVEKDPVAFAQTAKVVSRLGYILHVAENGHEGFRLYQEVKPDLVLSEAELPLMDGMEMARQIRTFDPEAQIIMTADRDDPYLLTAALEMGVQQFILKPHTEEQLVLALEKCVQNLRHRVELDRMKVFSQAVDQGALAIVITNAEGIIEYANTRYCDLAGYTGHELMGQELAFVESGNRFADLYRSMTETLRTGRQWKGDVQGRNHEGESWKSLSISPVLGPEGEVAKFIGVAEDITLQKRSEEEIRKLNSELEFRMIQRNASLEASKKELDDFCDAVSHDLRGPLSRLQGFSTVLIEECRDTLDEQGRMYVERIGSTCRELKNIVDSLLNLSQLTRRGMVYQEVELGALARSIADELSAREPERNIDWVISPGMFVKGDSGLLKILLENLLGNAWKCTIRNTRARIEIGVARSDSKTVYFVRDNGIGFDQKYAGKLFRPFQRIHSAEEFSGAGLGLAAVQRIIQRHGGRIWVEGEVERGATFYFTLN